MTEHWTSAQYRAYMADKSRGAPTPRRSGRYGSFGKSTRPVASTAPAPIKDAADEAPRKKPVQHEYGEQRRFFLLVAWLGELHPDKADELLDVYSTSSGGVRHFTTAIRLRLAGQRKGIPDIECMVPNHGFHALFIELKPVDRGSATVEQAERIERLSRRGYKALIVHGWVNAGRVLCDYLDLPFPAHAEDQVELRLMMERGRRKRRACAFTSKRPLA